MGLLRIRTTSRSPKRKPTKAELEAEDSYKKMLAEWDKFPKFARAAAAKVAKKVEPMPEESIEKKGKLDSGSTAPPKSQKYTGTAVVGIATLHKSNAIPVFSTQEALEVSKMRRG